MTASGSSARRALSIWIALCLLLIVPASPAAADSQLETFTQAFRDALASGDPESLAALSSPQRNGREDRAWLEAWAASLRVGSGDARSRLVAPSEAPVYDATIPALRVGQGVRILDRVPEQLLAWTWEGGEEWTGLVREDGSWRWLWPTDELRGREIVAAFDARQALLRRGAPLRGLPPLPLRVVKPIAPASMVDHGNGCARLVFTIRADGSVEGIRFNARPTSAYGKAARDALAQWRFAPTDEDRETFQSFAFEINTEGRWSAGYADGDVESEACRGLAWP
jgi:hypothetical protein